MVFVFVNFVPNVSDLIYKFAAKNIPTKNEKEKFFLLGPRKLSVEDVAHA